MLRLVRFLVFFLFFAMLIAGGLKFFELRNAEMQRREKRAFRVSLLMVGVGLVGSVSMACMEGRFYLMARRDLKKEESRLKRLRSVMNSEGSSSIYSAPPTATIWDGAKIYRAGSGRRKRSGRR
jgi:hypothetical protein